MKIIQTQLLILLLQFVVFALLISLSILITLPLFLLIIPTMIIQFVYCMYKAFTSKQNDEKDYQNYFIAAILIPLIGFSACTTFFLSFIF